MRHIYGIGLAIAMAAAVFFAASWGYLRLLRLPGGTLPAGGGSLIHNTAVLEGFAVLLGVGLLTGLLMAVPWVSPLATGLPGLALLAWTGLYLFSVREAVRFIPLKTHAYGAGFEALLFDGLLALAGLAMIIPLFIPSRWRPHAVAPWAAGPTDGELTSAYPGFTATPTAAGDSALLADWAETRPQPQIDPGPTRPSQAPWGPAEYS